MNGTEAAGAAGTANATDVAAQAGASNGASGSGDDLATQFQVQIGQTLFMMVFQLVMGQMDG